MNTVAAAMAYAREVNPRYQDPAQALEFAVGATGVDGGWCGDGWTGVVAAARAGNTTAVELLCVLAETQGAV